MADAKSLIVEIIKQLPSETNTNEIAWWILEFVTKKQRSVLLSTKNLALNFEQQRLLKSILHDYTLNKKPLQYILGTVPFGDLTIQVRPPILIPRPETEEWCYDLIQKLTKFHRQKLTILDLCTGTGCIGLAFAKEFKNSEVHLIDISESAVELAKSNAKFNNIKNVTVYKSNLFDNIPKAVKFDLIVSNPPYINAQQWRELDASVKNWEDYHALVALQEGLEIINKIIEKSKDFLKANIDFEKDNIPQIAIEIDYTQGKIVKELLEEKGYKKANILKDLYGNDRLAIANL